jgi:hypothetical protein
MPATGDVAIFTILDSSNYMFGENGGTEDLPYGGPGIEVGTYTLDSTNAQVAFNVTYETNGDWGPSTVGAPPGSIQITNLNTTDMTLLFPSDGLITLTRVPTDPTNPIIGSWYFTGTGMGSTILVLLNNGQYYAVQVDSADAGNRFFESGTYTWNSIDGTFTGTGLFSSNPSNSAVAAPGEINTSNATVSGNTLTFSDVDGPYTATRL